jgi:2-polyprenyl-6-hydroxyphenyl methylase/3-demethylubiquinone-9 3-methyltransferase
MLPKGTHDYDKFIKPSELAACLRKTQLEMHNISGMTFNPITKNYRIGKDVDVNYLVHASRPE